jgi:hypothetical protein
MGSELPLVPVPTPPPGQAHLLRRLGPFAGEHLTTPLGPAYRFMSELAVSLWSHSEQLGYDPHNVRSSAARSDEEERALAARRIAVDGEVGVDGQVAAREDVA